MLSTEFWDQVKEEGIKLVARIALLLVIVFPIAITVMLLLGKFNKQIFRDKAIREHNEEMRREHRTLKANEEQRLEEIRQELLNKEAKEVWTLWTNVFKRPLG